MEEADAARAETRRAVPRHRQDRRARGDPDQARAADPRGAPGGRAAHRSPGERILSAVDFLEDVLPLVRHEHERWDGRGYPDGLTAEDIPLGSRIILACDAYDAMLADRPYRPPVDSRRRRMRSCCAAPAASSTRAWSRRWSQVLAEEDRGQEALSESSEERQSRSTLAR